MLIASSCRVLSLTLDSLIQCLAYLYRNMRKRSLRISLLMIFFDEFIVVFFPFQQFVVDVDALSDPYPFHSFNFVWFEVGEKGFAKIFCDVFGVFQCFWLFFLLIHFSSASWRCRSFIIVLLLELVLVVAVVGGGCILVYLGTKCVNPGGRWEE